MLHYNEFSVNNQLKLVELFAQSFEQSINRENSIGLKIKFNISCGYSRCMARICDLSNRSKVNINTRCSRSSSTLGLCKLHLKKNLYGRVDEYPSEQNLIAYYKDNYPDIISKLILTHNPYYIFKSKCNKIKLKLNLDLKKNNNYKSKMSLEIIDYKQTLDTINKSDFASSEDIVNIITQKYGIEHITIGEKREIIKNIKKYSNAMIVPSVPHPKKIRIKYGKEALINSIKSVKLSTLESIQLNDLEGGECEVFIYHFNNTNHVFNTHKKLVGTMNEWIDEEGEVPEAYKTNDNLVLVPKLGLPMSEIIITESGAMFCNIKEDVYREYDYNDELESFIKTNRFIRFE